MDGGSSPAERASFTTRPLDTSTWDAFAELVERNNGVYGGCWCIAHHAVYKRSLSDPRTLKEELVRAGPCACRAAEAQGRFRFSATVELFEQYEFTRGRQVGKHASIVSREIDPA